MDNVRLEFLGNKEIGRRAYTGDGLSCDIDSPQSCQVVVDALKAGQLLTDFPGEWKFGGDERKFLKEVTVYRNKMIAQAEANKAFRIIYADGTEKEYPEGTLIDIHETAVLPSVVTQEAQPAGESLPTQKDTHKVIDAFAEEHSIELEESATKAVKLEAIEAHFAEGEQEEPVDSDVETETVEAESKGSLPTKENTHKEIEAFAKKHGIKLPKIGSKDKKIEAIRSHLAGGE